MIQNTVAELSFEVVDTEYPEYHEKKHADDEHTNYIENSIWKSSDRDFESLDTSD